MNTIGEVASIKTRRARSSVTKIREEVLCWMAITLHLVMGTPIMDLPGMKVVSARPTASSVTYRDINGKNGEQP